MIYDLAIIPAWRGSEGIPNKTMVDFCGQPLLKYTVDFCLPLFRSVLVSTNDPDIGAEAAYWGAVYMQSEIHDADGFARFVWKDALEKTIADESSTSFYLELTSPLRHKHDLERCWRAVTVGGYDCAATVSKSVQPCGKALTIWFDGEGKKHFGEYEPGALTNKSRAGMKRTYHRNGCCYAALNSHILSGKMMEENCCPVVIDRPIVNIDSPNDLLIAELLWRHLHPNPTTT